MPATSQASDSAAAAAASAEADPYEILGVGPDATAGELRAAYRRRARQCHPDAGGSHRQMVELAAAWEMLSDPVKRLLYDERRANPADAAVASEWAGVRAAATTVAEQYPRDWDEFTRWADEVAGGVRASRGGRAASGAVAGLLVGAAVGGVAGAWAGIGAAAGAAIGLVTGALAGMGTALSQKHGDGDGGSAGG